MKASTRWALVSVLALSLFVRLAYFAAYSARMESLVRADARTHVLLAVNLLSRGYYGAAAPWSYRPPLYPFFLSGIFCVFGENLMAARAVQAVAAMASYLVLYFVARRVFGEGVALLSLLFMALDFSLIHYCGLFYSETLYILLQALLLLLLMRGFDETGAASFAAAGVVLGLAALCRPTALAFVPFLFIAPLFRERKVAIYSRLLLTLALGLLVTGAWTARNYGLHGKLVPISTNGGTMLWMGLHHGASGSYDWPEVNNPLYDVEDEVERSRLGYSESLRFVRECPGEFLLLTAKKLVLFFEFYPYTYSGIQFAALIPLFLAGLWLSRRRWRELLLLYLLMLSFLGVHLLVHASQRYREPLVPFFWIFAAYAVSRLWHRLKNVPASKRNKCHQDTVTTVQG